MKSARWLLLPLSCLAACGTAREWNEMKTAPMTFADVYDGVAFVATTGGMLPDSPNCDRGNGTWQSRWKTRSLEIFGLGRYRLRTEVLLDEGSAKDGWTVRYVVDAEMVKDARRRRDPKDEDWSDAGQDREAEALFAERLQRRIGRKP